jgi:hypothetical protein
MPSFHITILNKDFCSTNQHECADVGAAQHAAIKGALEIGIDQLTEDKPFFGAEITVEDESRRVGHYVVALGISPLKI